MRQKGHVEKYVPFFVTLRTGFRIIEKNINMKNSYLFLIIIVVVFVVNYYIKNPVTTNGMILFVLSLGFYSIIHAIETKK